MIIMDNEAYHEESEHISKSGLDLLRKSPMHFKKRAKQQETPAMALGKATHHFILEPETFQDHYVVGPDLNKNTKVYKQFVTDHQDYGIVDRKDLEIMDGMAESIQGHEKAAELLNQPGFYERSFFAELDGVKCKCRPDWISDVFYSTNLKRETRAIIDLKTAKQADSAYFTRTIFSDFARYHVQAAFYLDVVKAAGYEADIFCFLVVEKEAPYPVALYNMSPDAIELGRIQYQEDLALYKDCLEQDFWPGYNNDQVEMVYPPHWLIKQVKGESTLWTV